MSNYERQRRFRARHPGYYNKYNDRNRQIAENATARMLAAAQAAQAAEAQLAAPALPAKQPLMLPAPVEPLLFPEMNALPHMVTRELEPIPIRTAD